MSMQQSLKSATSSLSNPRTGFCELRDIILDMEKPLVEWAYCAGIVPVFYPSEAKTLCGARFSFWNIVNGTIKTERILPRLKHFKHGPRSLYSKTKVVVDGSVQARAILRSSTPHLKYEQKLISQVINNLAVDSFISWRIFKTNLIFYAHSEFFETST